MKMPEVISSRMVAPCGMNCMVCFTHCSSKKPCGGCMGTDESKPGHCRTCLRKNCAAERGISYCYECCDFPCRRIRDLDRSYRKRYGASLIGQSLYMKGKRNRPVSGRRAEAVYMCGLRRNNLSPRPDMQ